MVKMDPQDWLDKEVRTDKNMKGSISSNRYLLRLEKKAKKSKKRNKYRRMKFRRGNKYSNKVQKLFFRQ